MLFIWPKCDFIPNDCLTMNSTMAYTQSTTPSYAEFVQVDDTTDLTNEESLYTTTKSAKLTTYSNKILAIENDNRNDGSSNKVNITFDNNQNRSVNTKDNGKDMAAGIENDIDIGTGHFQNIQF